MSLPLTSLAALCAGLVVLAWPPSGRAEHAVDANLVTALDASDSIMRHEEWIELDGMRRAVEHPAFLAAVRAGRHQRVGFAAFTWSSHGTGRLVVPWTVLGSRTDVERVAHMLAQVPRRTDRTFGGGQDRDEVPAAPDRRTDVSAALRYGLDLLVTAPHRTDRPILNICGNGVDNVGEGPERARDTALRAGVIVNGLIVGRTPALAAYYRERVAGGPGSFVIEMPGPAAVAEAMLRKFLLDLLAGGGTEGQGSTLRGGPNVSRGGRRGCRGSGPARTRSPAPRAASRADRPGSR